MKLTYRQIDAALAALRYFSMRKKDINGANNSVVVVDNPCVFPEHGWDLMKNEAALDDAHSAHRKINGDLLKKYVAAGMPVDKPSADFLKEVAAIDANDYDIDIIMIPKAAFENQAIPPSYLVAVRFMIDFGEQPKPKARTAK